MLSVVRAIVFGLAISTLINGYIYLRAIRPANLPRWAHRALVALMAGMFVAIPLTTWSRNAYPEVSATFGWISLPWMALTGLVFVGLVLLDLGRLLVALVDRGRRHVQKLPPPGDVALAAHVPGAGDGRNRDGDR